MIPLKSEEDLRMLKVSGQILARVMRVLEQHVAPGVTTLELDRLAQDLIIKEGARPAFKGYKGYPASICASVNEEVVHGIPTDKKLEVGDIISIDAGVEYQGYFSDAAITVPVGKIDAKKKKLIEVTKKALSLGIKQTRAGNQISDISYAIQNYVENNGFSVVRQFVGHGIGVKLHEEPEIPNFGKPHCGEFIKAGMVLAIEPMVNAGSWECEILDNGWTAVTVDNQPSAHFEDTIVVTENGVEILTRIN